MPEHDLDSSFFNENISVQKIINIGKNKKKIKKHKNLKIIHFNCNGIISKSLTIGSFLKQEKPSIMSLNELRCTEPNANDSLRFENYNCYYKCRQPKGSKQVGGGVALLIDEKLEQSEEPIPEQFQRTEAVSVKAKINDKWYTFVSIYNPPEQKLEKEFLNYINSSFKNILIIGDLNAKIKELSGEFNSKGKELELFIKESNLHILNNKRNPTNFCKKNSLNSFSVLDYFIGSENFFLNQSSYTTITNSVLSAHFKKYYHVPIKIEFNYTVHTQEKPIVTNENYNYDKADWKKFNLWLEDRTWKSEENDINIQNSELTCNINESAKLHIPLTKTDSNPLSLPYYILDMIKFKKKLKRAYNKSGSDHDKENLYSYIDCSQNEIKRYKSSPW